jgi:hypothetical protein
MSLAPERPPAASPPGDATPDRTPSLARSLLRTARPKQWAKNVLVFAAPGAAGVLNEPDELARTLVAFVAFCLAASGTYFLNDALDADADRHHPVKRFRPIAAGHLGVGTAKVIAVVLMLAALGVSAPFNSGKLALVVGGYIAITVSYSLWLKHEPVVDLGAVAAGFVLRAIAGGVATDVPLSDWFLIVAGAGSLFIVTGKRHAEQLELGEAAVRQREQALLPAEELARHRDGRAALDAGREIALSVQQRRRRAEAVPAHRGAQRLRGGRLLRGRLHRARTRVAVREDLARSGRGERRRGKDRRSEELPLRHVSPPL